MDFKKFNEIAELIGILAIVASLVFVGVQVRQTQTIGEGESAISFIEVAAITRGLLADHTEIWVRGCKGEELSESQRAEFAQLVRAYGQAQYFAWLSTKNGILNMDGSELVFAIAANIHRYPGFASMNDSIKSWGRLGSFSHESVDEYRNAVRLQVAELRQTDPNPHYDAALCGM